MQVFFLSSSKPIRKEYELDNQGHLVKHPYPFVYEVTSHEHKVLTLADLYKFINKYAAKGSCLLKGQLARPLVSESRAGSTDANEKTDWICLDLDGIEGYQNIDLFLDAIGCGGTEYIVQWSSSMGIENQAGFRCHVFMRLAQATHPQLLKNWLQDINLKVLGSQLELTKTGNALRWPLDVTTCQNDKLLYIAPPLLGPGINDPFPKGSPRISKQTKSKQLLVLPQTIPSKDALRQAIDIKVSALRVAQGLPKRKTTKYKFAGTVEYMVSPDSAVITEMKTERGFTYFNLNGGNSWAYYHPEGNPKFINNFKGEPIYRTEDLLPEYWASLQQATSNYQPNSKGEIFLAFRDFRTSSYYNGWYDTSTEKLNIAAAKSETQLRQFMKQHGQHIGEFIPDWDLKWDPHNPQVVDVVQRSINTYQPSPFYLIPEAQLPHVTQIPPTIMKVIDHVLGHDATTIDHFLNWLACVIQFQTITGTAWVLQGTEGTGKGVLFHQILSKLVGAQNTTAKRMGEIESEFTGFMENKFLVLIDEIEAGKSLYHDKITAKLKNLIVEPVISIRAMYTPAFMATNYSNMLFASNKPAPVEVPPDDRRFNVAPYQATPIQITSHEIDDLIPKELTEFFAFLKQYPADQSRARKRLKSAAHAKLVSINRTALDTMIDALVKGDLQFFWDHLSTNPKDQATQLGAGYYAYTAFRDLVVDIVQNGTNRLTREELYTLAEWCVGNIPKSPNKFTAMLKHHNVHLTQVWKHNRNVRGIDTNWVIDPVWLAQAKQEITNGSV